MRDGAEQTVPTAKNAKSGVEMASLEIAARMWLKHLRPGLNRKHVRGNTHGRGKH